MSEVIRVQDVEIDLADRTVKRAGETIDLTTSEFDLLTTLTSPAGRVFTRAQLLDSLRGISFESYERAIDSHIKNLRKKLEVDPRSPQYVQTVYGVGYKFNDEI